MNDTIKYIASGFLGDFIYQLSVVNENYLTTGKKGVIFLADKSFSPNMEGWKFGIEQAYDDLRNIISAQNYIEEFKIYNKEWFYSYINLSKWRQNSLLFKMDFSDLCKNEYNVNWGEHIWLTLPINKKYSDNIFISSVDTPRLNPLFNYNSLKKYNKDIYFISNSKGEYENFCEVTGCNFELIFFDTLYEYWSAINSCYLFVSSFGSFLCAAHAMHKNNIALLPYSNADIMVKKDFINTYWFKNYNECNLPDILKI
jgi:hypothetical protein